jgi:hypothetical protein
LVLNSLRYPPYRRVGQNLKPEVQSWVRLLYKGLSKEQSLKSGARHHTSDRSPPTSNFKNILISFLKKSIRCVGAVQKTSLIRPTELYRGITHFVRDGVPRGRPLATLGATEKVGSGRQQEGLRKKHF